MFHKSPTPWLSQEDIIAVLINPHSFIIGPKPPSHQFKNDQSSAGAGHLFYCRPEESSVQPSSPATVLFHVFLTTMICLPISTIVATKDMRLSPVALELLISLCERITVNTLNKPYRMLNHLLRDGSGDTSKHQKRRLNRIVRSYDKATIKLVHFRFQHRIPIRIP